MNWMPVYMSIQCLCRMAKENGGFAYNTRFSSLRFVRDDPAAYCGVIDRAADRTLNRAEWNRLRAISIRHRKKKEYEVERRSRIAYANEMSRRYRNYYNKYDTGWKDSDFPVYM